MSYRATVRQKVKVLTVSVACMAGVRKRRERGFRTHKKSKGCVKKEGRERLQGRYPPGPSCSKAGYRYPTDKSLFSGYVLGKPFALSTGQRFIPWIVLSTFWKTGARRSPPPFSLARGLAPKFPSPSLSNACHAGHLPRTQTSLSRWTRWTPLRFITSHSPLPCDKRSAWGGGW